MIMHERSSISAETRKPSLPSSIRRSAFLLKFDAQFLRLWRMTASFHLDYRDARRIADIVFWKETRSGIDFLPARGTDQHDLPMQENKVATTSCASPCMRNMPRRYDTLKSNNVIYDVWSTCGPIRGAVTRTNSMPNPCRRRKRRPMMERSTHRRVGGRSPALGIRAYQLLPPGTPKSGGFLL